MQIKTFANAPVFSVFQDFAVVVQTGTIGQISQALEILAADPMFEGKPKANACFAKFRTLLASNVPQWPVFAKQGNSKLPFVSFSTLPGVTCPGAGECLSFCYSFSSWRYPDAFFKQAQNAYLMRFHPTVIGGEFEKLFDVKKLANGFDFRLYVDGDFSSVQDVSFWMELLRVNPTVNAYGYSKSFAELLKYDQQSAWPANYTVNLSSGHNADPVTAALFEALPIVRGRFSAVNVGYAVTSAMHGTKEHDANVRKVYAAQTGKKAFVCPGECGSCTPKGHACGSKRFQNVDIIIAVH